MNKKKIRFLFPLIHFLVSFGYERLLFVFNDFDSMYTEALYPDVVSDKCEYILTYIMTKLFAGLFICLVWQLVFLIVDKKIPKKVLITFSAIFVLGIFIGLFVWPESFGISIDNYITYFYSLRFIPFYWHHMLTGCVYGAMMMVIPHTVSIALIQWLFLVWTVGYLFYRVQKSSRFAKNIEWITLGLLLLPEFYEVAVNPYRNVLYTILCINFFTVITMDALDKRELDKGRIVYLVLTGTMMTLWRSEGLILGIFGVIVAVFAGYRCKLKKAALTLALFAVCMFLIGRPQKLGQEKYYGNDYLIVSSLRPIQYILNSEDANLSYRGAKEDVDAIAAIVPLDKLKQWGLIGYMSNNRLEGREDVDQSFATNEEKSEYLKAYAKMAIHNIKPCMVSQLNYFYRSLGINYQYYAPEYRGEDSGETGYWLTAWDKGMAEYAANTSLTKWENSSVRIKIASLLESVRMHYSNFWNVIGLFAFGHVACIAVAAAAVVAEIVRFFKGKRNKMFVGIMLLLWLAELAIVVVGMPYSYALYLYPFIFSAAVLEFLYFAIRPTSSYETPTAEDPQLS